MALALSSSRMLVLLSSGLIAGCQTDQNCSLNGVCENGTCSCDKPWAGDRCQTLKIAPGKVGVNDIPLCAYHGDGPNSTSWGASILRAPEDGLYYAWVASMVGGCSLASWDANYCGPGLLGHTLELFF